MTAPRRGGGAGTGDGASAARWRLRRCEGAPTVSAIVPAGNAEATLGTVVIHLAWSAGCFAGAPAGARRRERR